MEEKFTAVYLMVRLDELKPEDQGSFEGPLAQQREECLEFLKNHLGGKIEERVEVYTRRAQLLVDVDRHLIKRVIVHSMDCLASSKEDLDGILFEFGMEGIEVLSVTGK